MKVSRISKSGVEVLSGLVFHNGLLLVPGKDYTYKGHDLELTRPAVQGDTFVVVRGSWVDVYVPSDKGEFTLERSYYLLDPQTQDSLASAPEEFPEIPDSAMYVPEPAVTPASVQATLPPPTPDPVQAPPAPQPPPQDFVPPEVPNPMEDAISEYLTTESGREQLLERVINMLKMATERRVPTSNALDFAEYCQTRLADHGMDLSTRKIFRANKYLPLEVLFDEVRFLL